MKIFISVFLCIFTTFTLYAQVEWSGTRPGDIYYNEGRVGIGKSPSTTLSVFKNNSADGNDWLLEIHRASYLGSSQSRGNGMYFRDINSIQAGIVADRIHSSLDYKSDLVFYTNNHVAGNDINASLTPKMRITHDGKVGIGKSPSTTLSVFKNNSADGNDWLLEIHRASYLGSSQSRGNGMYFRDINSIQAGIVADRIHSSLDYKSDLVFYTNNHVAGNDINTSLTPKMRITHDGKVGIGTDQPDAELAVAGKIHAEEVKVSTTVPAPDYVFEEDYPIASLDEIKAYISANKHLPEVPSAKEMEANGIKLGEMNMLLLKKIEELTLLMIEQNQTMKSYQTQLTAQQKEIEQLKKKIQ